MEHDFENINSKIDHNKENNNDDISNKVNDKKNDNNNKSQNNLSNDENINSNENKENEINTESNGKKQEIIEDKDNNKINPGTSKESIEKLNLIEIPPNQYMKSIDIVKKNYCMYDLDNSFAIFKPKNGQLYLIYPLLNSFICFDIIDEEIVTVIKNAHEFYVLNFRYIYDSFSKRDLVQTISGEDNNIKLWNIENWECLLNLRANSYGIMFSSCFLYDDTRKENFLVSSNCTGNNYIQVFDFKGKKIKDVPFHEEKDKSSDDNHLGNDNDNENNYDDDENDENNDENEQNNENNNSDHSFHSNDNNNKSNDDDKNNIKDDNKSINSDKEIEENEENKNMNSNGFNYDKDNIINIYNNINEYKDDIKNDDKYNSKNDEPILIKEEKENEENNHINSINNENNNNYIYKCYPEDNKDNLINISNNDTEFKNINQEKIDNLKEDKKNEINQNDITTEQKEDIKLNINNEQINSANIGTKSEIKLNDFNTNEISQNENNTKNINNDSINSQNNEINNNDDNQENEINTNNNENNMGLEVEPEHNDNSNISNNNENHDNNEDIQSEEENLYEVKIDHIYYIDSYYDKKLNTTYIISCCNKFVKSFNYNTNTLYHVYIDKEVKKDIHGNDIVDDSNDNLVKLFETCNDGYVRIWDFHFGDLLNKIKICDDGIKSICIWDENTIFVGCDDATIKMVDINKNEILHVLYGHRQRVCCLKIVEHEKYGKCFISKGWGGDFIKLWKKNEL